MSWFNAEEVPEQQSYDPLPSGDYVVQAVEAEVKGNQAGTGEYLALTLEVLDGPGNCTGRKLFPKFTLAHPNPKATETGRRLLATICRATGVMAPSQPEELCGIPFCARVVVKTRKDTGEPTNECSQYWSTQAQAPAQPKAAVAKAQAAQQPWQQRAQPAHQVQPAAPAPAVQPWAKPAQAPWAKPQAVAQPQAQPEPESDLADDTPF